MDGFIFAMNSCFDSAKASLTVRSCCLNTEEDAAVMIPNFPPGSCFSLGFSPPSLCLWKLQQIDASVMELTHSRVNGARHLNRPFPEDMNILTHAKDVEMGGGWGVSGNRVGVGKWK